MNKILGGVLVVLALTIGIAPLFTDCLSQGAMLTTAAGTKVPMKCHWTAIAEIGAAVPLLIVGVITFFSKRKETVFSMNLVGAAMGALAVAFPTVLIGVCANPTHICNLVEKPLLILGGTLAVAASAIVLFRSRPTVSKVVA